MIPIVQTDGFHDCISKNNVFFHIKMGSQMGFTSHNEDVIGINRDNVVVYRPISKFETFVWHGYDLTFFIAKKASTRNSASFHSRYANSNGFCKDGRQIAVEVGWEGKVGIHRRNATIFFPIMEAIAIVGDGRKCDRIAMDVGSTSKNTAIYIVVRRDIDIINRWRVTLWMNV